MLKNILLLSFTIIIFQGCLGEKEDQKWSTFIYPNKDNTKRNVLLQDSFLTLDSCKSSAIAYLKENNIKNGTFTCALNCSYNENVKTQVCEKMIKE